MHNFLKPIRNLIRDKTCCEVHTERATFTQCDYRCLSKPNDRLWVDLTRFYTLRLIINAQLKINKTFNPKHS